MDAGWLAVWNNARCNPPAQVVFSLHRIVGSFLGGMFLSVERKISMDCSLVEGRSSRRSGWIKVRDAFSRASSVVWWTMWGDKHKSTAVPAVLLLAASVWPPFITPHSCEAAVLVAKSSSSAAEEKLQIESVARESDMVVEPQSGAEFPLYLLNSGVEESGLELHSPSQVLLAGMGVRCRQLMKVKSINLYAFGMYVHPESLRAQLGEKYAGVSASELKFRSEFYDDLLRNHEVKLSVRLVVLYKGLTAELIRSAFQVSLKNRLKKIKGTEDDEGLDVFCSYLSGDLKIRKGTVIDIHWQPGGKLQTVVDGRQVGTIFSENLCRAFFDLYIGDPPVSSNAKHSIGESFAKILNSSGPRGPPRFLS